VDPPFPFGFHRRPVLRPLLVLSWVGTPGLGKKPVCGVCGGDRKQPRPSLTNHPHSCPFPLTPRPSGPSPEACRERVWRMDRLKPVCFYSARTGDPIRPMFVWKELFGCFLVDCSPPPRSRLSCSTLRYLLVVRSKKMFSCHDMWHIMLNFAIYDSVKGSQTPNCQPLYE